MGEPLHCTPKVSVASLLEKLEGSFSRSDAAPPVVATDADGTLWSGDVGIDLFETLLASKQVREEARDALAQECRSIAMPDTGSAFDLAARLYDAFARNLYPEARGYAMMAWAFAGYHEDEMAHFAQAVVRDGRVHQRVFPEMRAILKHAEAHGVDVWVVSASPLSIVRAAANLLSVPSNRVLAMTSRVTDGVLAPELALPPTYAEGKATALAPHLKGRRLVAAFGDSNYDAAMMMQAEMAVAVAPKPSLVAKLPAMPHAVELLVTEGA